MVGKIQSEKKFGRRKCFHRQTLTRVLVEEGGDACVLLRLRVQCHKFTFVSISSIKITLASGLGEEGGEGKTGVQRKSSKGGVMS